MALLHAQVPLHLTVSLPCAGMDVSIDTAPGPIHTSVTGPFQTPVMLLKHTPNRLILAGDHLVVLQTFVPLFLSVDTNSNAAWKLINVRGVGVMPPAQWAITQPGTRIGDPIHARQPFFLSYVPRAGYAAWLSQTALGGPTRLTLGGATQCGEPHLTQRVTMSAQPARQAAPQRWWSALFHTARAII